MCLCMHVCVCVCACVHVFICVFLYVTDLSECVVAPQCGGMSGGVLPTLPTHSSPAQTAYIWSTTTTFPGTVSCGCSIQGYSLSV